ncbi:alpha/beta hydrolase fold domain-containing protein [Pseudosulfitobacter sp. SM2401]|uniref:alpha/beta hydrolase fold domain-containing protein n=1 Tax=Pseudosulfitobacter sp. SM2401 TaxID=3350098 RepID=UPI0036F1C543
MSWQKAILNPILKRVEKPQLARATDPVAFRRAFERKAKIMFHGPRDVEREEIVLGDAQALHLTGSWADAERVILYFHGGANVFGSPKTHAAMIGQLAKRAGVDAILPCYPLAPEHSFPAAIDSARASYDAVLARGYAPHQIVMGGDSAGGGLVLALLGQLLAESAPVPAGVFAFSPLCDLTFDGASITVNAAHDVILPASRVSDMAEMYLGTHDPTDPRASALFADFTDAPPVWLTVGDTEILMDDTRRITAKLQRQGVDVQMHLEKDVPHVWPFFHNYLPEARATLDRLAGWINRRPGWSDGS